MLSESANTEADASPPGSVRGHSVRRERLESCGARSVLHFSPEVELSGVRRQFVAA